jgi:hypothetical protein
MVPSSETARRMIAEILETMTDRDIEIVDEVLREFKSLYTESRDSGNEAINLIDEQRGFRIDELSSKQMMYLKSLGFVIRQIYTGYGSTRYTLNFP